MKNIILMLSLLISLTSCAQEQKSGLTIALCEKGKGCKEIIGPSNLKEIAQLLNRPDLAEASAGKVILVIEKCEFKKESKLTLAQIHQSYGGTGEPEKIKNFDLAKYVKENGCMLNCGNATKKITFHINTTGEDAVSGNGYFFLNLKAGEAFMPNESVQQFYGSEMEGVVLDQLLRKGKIDSYMITEEGEKIYGNIPVGINMSVIKNDAMNEKRFKTDFKKTGNTKNQLNSTATEYTGKDDGGNTMSLWIMPVTDVCLPKGKFDAFGFYNLGYISVDGITYLVTEISGSGFQITMTGISDGSYNFNPIGYKNLGNLRSFSIDPNGN
ncbi:MAG: hypothetical protein E6Q39_02915 [Crocinitomicaceae bacterium]|nr:MAG: hypothetical protein E6Q39_02915 [Crocinitomicaceae bacterium]